MSVVLSARFLDLTATEHLALAFADLAEMFGEDGQPVTQTLCADFAWALGAWLPNGDPIATRYIADY